ncbi:MAG: NADH-quinone oxidoreductase subunit A [Bdellovibrionaceae bacterium]|nr:NADH-quinone oxidoreductase subunit A [Pseudobdellovibrionaceae bacterium]
MEYIFIIPVILAAFLLVFGGLWASSLFAPSNPGQVKNATYECGEKTIGNAWVQFNVGYYLFGLIFLVFDVEAAFLFPWAVVLRETGILGLIEVLVFILILILGLIYAWRKGALEWV